MRYVRNPDVLWRSTSRGPIVLAPGNDAPVRLGGVAAVVWELLDDPLTAADVSALVDEMLPEASEVDAALAELRHSGLCTVRGD